MGFKNICTRWGLRIYHTFFRSLRISFKFNGQENTNCHINNLLEINIKSLTPNFNKSKNSPPSTLKPQPYFLLPHLSFHLDLSNIS